VAFNGTNNLDGQALAENEVFVRFDECAPVFRRGDVNATGTVDTADAIYLFQHLFAGGPGILCPDAADANDDEALDLGDGIYILQFLFAGGAPIPAPYPGCGPDTTPNPNPLKPDLPPCRYCPDLCKSPPEMGNCP
jgi:hypothetical protein